jgi:hypothetical protein
LRHLDDDGALPSIEKREDVQGGDKVGHWSAGILAVRAE